VADIRSFVAVEIDEAIITRLSTVQQHLRGVGAQVSWVRPEGMHLTLKFLGNVPEHRLPEITHALETAVLSASPFRLSVIGVGGFPNLSRMRVVWAGIAQGAEALCALAAAVDQQLATVGFPREERPFSPHITLGRVKAPEGVHRLAELLRTHEGESFGEMPVTHVRLMRSDLLPTGARYTMLRSFPLLGTAA